MKKRNINKQHKNISIVKEMKSINVASPISGIKQQSHVNRKTE